MQNAEWRRTGLPRFCILTSAFCIRPAMSEFTRSLTSPFHCLGGAYRMFGDQHILEAFRSADRRPSRGVVMRIPLKLSAIDQEHLQELYDAAGIARDELPYSDAFEQIWQGFQDRTFKNAEREQVFGALLKYTRSSGNASTQLPESKLSDEQLKQLKGL